MNRDTAKLLAVSACLVCMSPAASASAGDSRDDTGRRADNHALHEIFRTESLQYNSRFVHRTAAMMPTEERYEFLASWVLPDDRHPTFRVTVEFGATNSPAKAESKTQSLTHLSSSIEVISPALDLVETARELGRLEKLQQRIQQTQLIVATAQQKYVRETLLFLIEVARNDSSAAIHRFDRVIDHAQAIDHKSVPARQPALLMLRAAIASPDNQLRRAVTEFFFSVYLDLKGYSHDPALDVINDHLRSMFSLNQFIDSNDVPANRQPELSEQWVPFVYSDSQTRGRGRPLASWHYQAGSVEKLSGHEMDYLSFRSPLRGNFEVECDFSTAHGKHFSFMVGGSHVQAVEEGASLRTGNFRKYSTDTRIDLPLTKFRSTARFRAVVRNGVLHQYLNGQEVHRRSLSPEHNPWVAIRAWRRCRGAVSDFRITGEPVIPDEINLTGDPELSGWASYFEAGFGPGQGNWQAVDDGQGGTGIFGNVRPEYDGSAVQKLLRYCRPIVEDGTIEYDFFYKKGESCVHPALDRLAFMLDPSGVRIHWITDRRYERSLLDPANLVHEPENHRGPQHVPLKENAWNRLKLDVLGDTVSLALNGQAIYERALDESNQRTFGLFHFADRTEARVHNVIWRGDWPKQLPSLEDQHLADTTLDFLDDDRQKLTEHFHHDFRKDPLRERFNLVGSESGLTSDENGARISLVNLDGARQLRSPLRISGDFDITASFQDLEQLMDAPRWELRAGVNLQFDSEITDACGFYRCLARNDANRRVSFNHSSRPIGKPFTVRGEYIVEESKSGRFRIIRRGKTVYGLYATADSPNFKLVSKREVTDAPVAIQGLRLTTMSAEDSSVGVTWKELDIRAEKLSGLHLTDPAPIIDRLNAQRDSLHARRISFTDIESIGTHFSPKTVGASTLRSEESGLRVTTVSSGDQRQFILASRTPFNHGTDVEFTFDIHQFGLDKNMESPCEIAMKVFYDTPERNNLNPRESTFILRKKEKGVSYLVTRIVHRNSAGNLAYRELHLLPVVSPDSFRVTVHEGTMYFLYSEADSDEYHIATTAPVRDKLPATSVQLKFVTNGKDHSNDLTMKQLIVHEADAINTN